MQKVSLMQKVDVSKKQVLHFCLPDLIPDTQKLALNLETRTLSLLADGPQLVAEQQLSANQLRMIIPILEFFPHYCPYEVLFAYFTSEVVTPTIIDRCHKYLQEAQNHGNWQQELRPVRRAISSLRNKLDCFQLRISTVRERGCALTGLSFTRSSYPQSRYNSFS
jgi:hypothetical protein